jgi:succinate dehydrogenase flavin-adding protein (antitoxin of CptAB toxin-antitoxin module)
MKTRREKIMFFGKTPMTIVTDCDEVLTDISPLWVSKILQDREWFEQYFTFPKELDNFDHKTLDSYKTVLSRKDFHLNKWLSNQAMELTEDQKTEVFDRFYALYDNEDFYGECYPTKMCQGLQRASMQSFVKKIYVVTRTSENTRESKEKFIRSFLGSNKVEIMFVGRNEKKSDYINQIDNVNMIIEDELSNIYDIAENCTHLKEIDLYIPYTGYNHPPEGFYEEMEKKTIKPIYYSLWDVEGRKIN